MTKNRFANGRQFFGNMYLLTGSCVSFALPVRFQAFPRGRVVCYTVTYGVWRGILLFSLGWRPACGHTVILGIKSNFRTVFLLKTIFSFR